MPQITFRRAITLVTLSAALTSFSFVPYNVYFLGFLGLIPAFYVFEHFSASRRQTVFLWLIWTLILNLVGYHWIMHTIAVYGMMPTFVAFPLFLLYSLGTGGKMLLFFFFLRWMYRRADIFSSAAKCTLAAAAAFGLCELIGWQLFPWHGANIVSGDLLFAQGADLIGTRGMSVVWVAMQFLLYQAGGDFQRDKQKSFIKLATQSRNAQVFLLIAVATHLYGYIQYSRFEDFETAAPKFVVGVPQGNVPLITGYHERPYIISRMVAQTQKLVADATAAGQKPDLIVWPESSIPAMEFERSEPLKAAIADLQKITQTPIIINDILHERSRNRDYSNMWHLDNQGAPLNNYQKNFLLPFGEFMPLGEKFPSLKSLFPAVSDFSHGEKFSLFNIQTRHGVIKAMPLICYEIILPDYARPFDARSAHEAQFIINITNDAWFGDSYESLQHMTLGTMRAIELRLPILRSTNSGISAYTASTGEVSGKTKLFERVNQLYAVPAMPRHQTAFAWLGNIPLFIFMLITGGFFALQHYRLRKAATA
ncbi:MAG: apolipoprotein N-acyltransferase [Turneriella sp.]